MDSLSCQARGKPFSFECTSCSICCNLNIIRVNPYDIARLASRLGVTTSHLTRTYTWAAGCVLRLPYNGNCIFRAFRGCSVHADRPLVCRLYPLRRNISDDRDETFSLVEREPECRAFYSDRGTIAGYLSEQDAIEPLLAMDRYLTLVDDLFEALRHATAEDTALAEDAARLCVAPSMSESEPVPELLDVDTVTARHIALTGSPQPQNLREKMEMHIVAVRTWLGTAMDEGICSQPASRKKDSGLSIDLRAFPSPTKRQARYGDSPARSPH